MIAVFADTSYWIALTNIDDADHEKAKTVMRSLPPRPLLTTEQVLTQYLNYFSAWGPRFRQKAAGNVQAMFSIETVRISPDVTEAFQAGLDLFRSRPDKGYSLTDCISMQTMRSEGLTDVLTNDRHFEQEGFRALFRS